MKLITVLLLGLFSSLISFADCEDYVGYWKVGFPMASANQTITFKLTNNYGWQMLVDAHAWEQNEYSEMYNELYHDSYENKIVNFGVTPDVCIDINSYLHQQGGVGGQNVLTLSKMMNLRSVTP